MSQDEYCYTTNTKISKFFDSLDAGKIMGTRCRTCGELYFPPRAECPVCMKEDLEWVEISGRAELMTYTVVHVAPKRWNNFVPFAVAVGQLEEGPKFLAVLDDVDHKNIKIGMKLKLLAASRPEGYPEPRFKYKFVPI